MDVEEPRTSPPPTEPAEELGGGDPACWAALVCPNCGALADTDGAAGRPDACPRCGEAYPVD
jgi:membrane protease subunit (stomatin/prohibitin family)